MTASTEIEPEVRTPAPNARVRTRPTEDNKPDDLDYMSAAMRRLRALSPLQDLEDDLDGPWKELVGLAYREGSRVVDVAWASGRRYNTARVYRTAEALGIRAEDISPAITHPSQGFEVPEHLRTIPELPAGLQELLDTDPARYEHVEFPPPPPRSERSTEENIPRGLVMTPILRRLYLVSRVLNVLDDLKKPLEKQTDGLLEIAVKENNPVFHIAWAWGRPAQRALIYRRLNARGVRHRPTDDGAGEFEELPVPDELLRLPGLANLDEAIADAE